MNKRPGRQQAQLRNRGYMRNGVQMNQSMGYQDEQGKIVQKGIQRVLELVITLVVTTVNYIFIGDQYFRRFQEILKQCHPMNKSIYTSVYGLRLECPIIMQ